MVRRRQMVRCKRAIGACILASVFQAIPALAATYYVNTTGSDSNPGTEKKPWQTVAHAVDIMVAGDTTYVRGGLYNEGTIRFKSSGTQSAPIKLLNYPGESPIIQCLDPHQYHRIILQNSDGINKPMGWITIEGFEIRNCYDGIKFYSAHDFTVRRNWMHNNLGAALLGNGTRILIDRNIVSSNGDGIRGGHGFYMSGTAIMLTNNLIYDNYKYNIQLNGSPSSYYDPTKDPGPEFSLSANWVIANNVIAYSKNRAGMVVWGSTCNNTLIENNIFYENGVNLPNGSVNGIDFVSTTCTGIQIRNNLAYASGAGATSFLSTAAIEGVHYMQSGNIVNAGDPRFVNAPATLPASPNFSLTERSPAIDKGLQLAITNIAFDGTARPQGRTYDIGAYEYVTDTDSKPPVAPTGLRTN